MKFKKVLSLVLVSALAGSLVGCSGSTTSSTTTGTDTTADNSKTESAATETAATTEADTDTAEVDLSDIIPDETVTLNVYSQLANYEGEQIGWFAQIMKDKFNVKLNIAMVTVYLIHVWNPVIWVISYYSAAMVKSIQEHIPMVCC